MPLPTSSPKNFAKPASSSAPAASNASSKSSACKKKLYRFRPNAEPPLQTQRTTTRTKPEPGDPRSIERGVRQLLADKISGNLVGLWLLIPEHLRLGTWDLLQGWTRKPTERVEPRLALQLVHEAALCTTGIRERRALSQKGFELVNGLPFLATDVAVHELLDAHTVAAAQDLQVALAKIRLASGHFAGKVLALDPHRVRSHSKRQMRRHRSRATAKSTKIAQTFFVLDVDTHQPVCLTTATSAPTVTKATPELLDLTNRIFASHQDILILADAEHFSAELLDHLHKQTQFHLLVPMPQQASLVKELRALPPELFTRRWAGFATAKRLYTPRRSQRGPFHQFIQRTGETPDSWEFKAFLATRDGDEVAALTDAFPKRWHVEEFFNANQALGWDRAGTQNLHIRFGQMSLALVAQAAIHQLRQRLGEPYSGWDASHFARALFLGLEGDVRVTEDTIIVTYYNAPNADRLRQHYEGLPDKLVEKQIDPRIPWLYNFKLDFRFR
jgi:Transposase DDE domain